MKFNKHYNLKLMQRRFLFFDKKLATALNLRSAKYDDIFV